MTWSRDWSCPTVTEVSIAPIAVPETAPRSWKQECRLSSCRFLGDLLWAAGFAYRSARWRLLHLAEQERAAVCSSLADGGRPEEWCGGSRMHSYSEQKPRTASPAIMLTLAPDPSGSVAPEV